MPPLRALIINRFIYIGGIGGIKITSSVTRARTHEGTPAPGTASARAILFADGQSADGGGSMEKNASASSRGTEWR